MISRVLLILALLTGGAFAQGPVLPGPGLPVAAAGYVGPLDVAGYTAAYAYWGLRCSKSSYTGNVADIWDAATGSTTETLLTCSSGGTINETINPLATTCAAGCKVKILYDQSGNTRHLNTATAGAIPTLVRSGVGVGSVPVVQCNSATNQEFTTSANAAALTQPFTLSQVMRTAGAISSNQDSFSSGNLIQIQTVSANTWLFYAGTVQNFTLNDTLWGASNFVFNGASSTSNVSNSTNNSSATPSSLVNAGSSGLDTANPLGICGRAGVGGLLFDGYILETIIVSGAVSAANQATLINNQRAYGGGF